MSEPIFVPPAGCYAVIFANQRTPQDPAGYGEMAQKMVEAASRRPGYLGCQSTRDGSGYGITVSYWDSEEAITAWRLDMEHQQAQQQGQEHWYQSYTLVVSKVERAKVFSKPSS